MRQITPLVLILTLLCTATLAKHNLLSNVEIELKKMVAFFDKGDTSHAFSIAVKVYFAV
jgi:hypothetical protein